VNPVNECGRLRASAGVIESLFSGRGDTEPLRLYILRVLSAYSPERDYTYDREPSEATFKAVVLAAFERDSERVRYTVASELRAPIRACANGSLRSYAHGYGYVDLFLDCALGQAVIELKHIPPKYIAPFFDGAGAAAAAAAAATESKPSSSSSSSCSSSSSSAPSSASVPHTRRLPHATTGPLATTVEEYLKRFDAMPWRDRQAFTAAKVRRVQALDAVQVGELLVSPRPAADRLGPREMLTANALNERSERDQAARYNAFPDPPRGCAAPKRIWLCGTLLGPNSCWRLTPAAAAQAPN